MKRLSFIQSLLLLGVMLPGVAEGRVITPRTETLELPHQMMWSPSEMPFPIVQAQNSQLGEAQRLFQEGDALFQQGTAESLQGAIEKFEAAIPLFQSAGEQFNEGKARVGAGSAYDILGFKSEALEHYEQALAIWEKLGQETRGEDLQNVQTWQAATLNNIGLVYDALGEKEKALDYYNQALSLSKEVGDRTGEANTLNNIGLVYYALGEKEKALDYYNQALPLRKAVGDRAEEAATLTNIGAVYYALGEKEKALDYYNQALPLLEAVRDRAGEAATLNNIGGVYSDLGEKEKALDYYNQALPLLQAVRDRSGEAATLYNLAYLKRSQGQLTQAATDMERAIDLLEQLRTSAPSGDLRQTFFATVQDRYQFYIDLLMELDRQNPNQGYDKKALHISESSRARTLTDLLTEAHLDINEGVDSQLLAQEKRLLQQLSATEKARLELISKSYDPEDLQQLEAQRNAITEQLSDLETRLRRSNPAYANLKYPDPLTLEEIQQQLDDDTLLLEYALGEERSYLFFVSKTDFRTYTLPSRTDIEAEIDKFRELLIKSKIEDLTQGQKLTQMLISPVADQLGQKRLVIVGNGKLQLLPFVALPLPNQNAPLLVNHEIVTLPSFTSLAAQREQWANRPQAPKTLAVIADAVFNGDPRLAGKVEDTSQQLSDNNYLTGQGSEPSEDQTASRGCRYLKPLPHSKKEAEVLLAQVPDEEEFQALGFNANRNAAISPQLANYRIVHLATHGCIDDNRLLSSLAFSLYDEEGEKQDAFVRLQDIFNLQLNAELVVLSACQTGVGENVQGEGVIGLTRGFMYAGAERVVISLWKVQDDATADLMEQYYEMMLEEEIDPLKALREAQLEMWKSEEWKAPFYWAAFTLQGEYN